LNITQPEAQEGLSILKSAIDQHAKKEYPV